MFPSHDLIVGKVIEEVERSQIGWSSNSIAAPTELRPVYERYRSTIQVSPITVGAISLRYLRKPKQPNWTYTVVSGKEFFNPADTSFQDFELHPSEFSNIVLRMLTHFGINLREAEVVQIAETLKDKANLRENN